MAFAAVVLAATLAGWAQKVPQITNVAGVATQSDGTIAVAGDAGGPSVAIFSPEGLPVVAKRFRDLPPIRFITRFGDGFLVGAGADLRLAQFLVSLDRRGTVRWARRYTSTTRPVFTSAAALPHGAIVVGDDNEHRAVAITIADDGRAHPFASLAVSGAESQFFATAPTQDGGIVASGWTGECGGMVIRLAKDGSPVWQNCYGVGASTVTSILPTHDGGFLAAGRTRFGNNTGTVHVFIAKLRGDGTIAWQRLTSGANDDEPYGAEPLANGHYLITVRTSSFGPADKSLLFLELTEDGAIVRQKAQATVPPYVHLRFTRNAAAMPSGGAVIAAAAATSGLHLIRTDATGGTGGVCALLIPSFAVLRDADTRPKPFTAEPSPSEIESTVFEAAADELPLSRGSICDADEEARLAALVRSRTATEEAAPDEPATSLKKQVSAMLMARSFEALDKMSTDFLTSRATIDPVTWKLTVFYEGLEAAANADPAEVVLPLFDSWIAQRPASATARIGKAKALLRYAWKARGGGYSNTVTARGARKYDDFVDQARHVLADARTTAAADPAYYETQMLANTGDDGGALLDRGLSIAPYPPLFEMEAEFLLPQWGGNVRSFRAIADRAVEATKAQLGETMYARLTLEWLNGAAEGRDKFDLGEFDWTQVRQGFRDWLARDPSPIVAHHFAYVASLFSDLATAHELFASPALRWSSSMLAVWHGKDLYDATSLYAAMTPAPEDPPEPWSNGWSVPRIVTTVTVPVRGGFTREALAYVINVAEAGKSPTQRLLVVRPDTTTAARLDPWDPSRRDVAVLTLRRRPVIVSSHVHVIGCSVVPEREGCTQTVREGFVASRTESSDGDGISAVRFFDGQPARDVNMNLVLDDTGHVVGVVTGTGEPDVMVSDIRPLLDGIAKPQANVPARK